MEAISCHILYLGGTKMHRCNLIGSEQTGDHAIIIEVPIENEAMLYVSVNITLPCPLSIFKEK